MNGTTATLFIFVVILVVIFGPLLTIWSLNTLFPVLNIAYNFYTWFAVIILGSFFRARVTK